MLTLTTRPRTIKPAAPVSSNRSNEPVRSVRPATAPRAGFLMTFLRALAATAA